MGKMPEQLKSIRSELGMTQREIAEHLGVSTNTWARWERGESKPLHEKMLRLALRDLYRL